MGIRHSTGSDRPGSPSPHEDRQIKVLTATVERLRAELAQLRGAQRTAAVVEQAKGVLAERLGCGVDCAYEHLLGLARDSGMTPVAAAALLLGLRHPAEESDRAIEAAELAPVFDPAGYLREPPPLRTLSPARPNPAGEATPEAAPETGPVPRPRAAPAVEGPPEPAEPASGQRAVPTGPGDGPPEAPLNDEERGTREGADAGEEISGSSSAAEGLPDSASPGGPGGRRRRAVDRHLVSAAFAAAASPDELAGILCADVLGWLGARAVLLATVDPDGALRLAGSYGVPDHVVSGWARIPPHRDIGLVRSLSAGAPLWPEETAGLIPTGGTAGTVGVRACAPLPAVGRVIGAAEIVWPEGTVLDEEQRRYVAAVTAACGGRLHALLRANGRPGGDPPWLRPLLEAIPGPAALLSPVRDEAGRLVDFLVAACNTDTADELGRAADDLTGSRLVQSHAGLASSGLFDAYVRVLETGVPLRVGPEEYAWVGAGRARPTTMSVRACRLGDGVLISWRFHDAADDLGAQLDQAQRLGNLGWGVWDLSTGTIRWSDQVFVIFGRDPAQGPLHLDEVAERVLPQDLPLAAHLVRRLLEQRERVDTELRFRRGREVRHLRLMAEPVLDPLGEPAAVRCVYQDVTGKRRDELALEGARATLRRQRRRIAEERRQAIELQRSILPLPKGIIHKPGLRAAVRYLPAGRSARVGGDWYETTAIDGRGVFLAIGDVSGHGPRSAAAMARLRNALSGLAFTGEPPDRLLGWLNRVALHWPPSLTATVLAGRYDPAEHVLTWAQAGHFPPVLARGGRAVTLDPPEGVLLGAVDDPEFQVERTRLEPGDLLLLYTDGLVERRERDLQDGVDLLVQAAASCDPADPEQVVERVLEACGAPNPNDDTCLLAIQIG